MGHSHYHDFPLPQDSPTFVRVPLTGVDGQGVVSCCGEVTKPEVDFLTNRWSVFLQNHIPQSVFDAMMRDIYYGPRFKRFLSVFYSPLGSVCGIILFCGLLAIPILMWNYNQMKAEVGRKVSAWNRVLSKYDCGVTMQINEYGLVFNILPDRVLDGSPDLEKQLLRELDLIPNSPIPSKLL